MRKVYMDYSATTPVKKEVLDEMLPYYSEFFGNPSSLYDIGADSKAALDKARSRVASLINADPSEVFFTSCGSEADNWALFGVTDALKEKGMEIDEFDKEGAIEATKVIWPDYYEMIGSGDAAAGEEIVNRIAGGEFGY